MAKAKFTGIPAFNGMGIDMGGSLNGDGFELVEIRSIFVLNPFTGEQHEIKLPVKSFYVDERHVDVVIEKVDPLGKFVFSTSFTKGEIGVVVQNHESGHVVSVVEGEKKRVIYTQNFFESSSEMKNEIDSVMRGEHDIDDLVMRLKDIKERELSRRAE